MRSGSRSGSRNVPVGGTSISLGGLPPPPPGPPAATARTAGAATARPAGTAAARTAGAATGTTGAPGASGPAGTTAAGSAGAVGIGAAAAGATADGDDPPSDVDAPAPAGGGDQVAGQVDLGVRPGERQFEVAEHGVGVDRPVGRHQPPAGTLGPEAEDGLEAGEEVALVERHQRDADEVLPHRPAGQQLGGEREGPSPRHPLLEDVRGGGAGRIGLEGLRQEGELLVEGHDRAQQAPVPLVAQRQAERLHGRRQDPGADHRRLTVLGDGEPLLVALEAGGALVDAGGQGHAPPQLGRAGHRDQRRAPVDGDRVAPAGLDEEIAVVEGEHRLDAAVDGQDGAGPELHLGVGQLEDGPAVDDLDLVAGSQRPGVGGPGERRAVDGDLHDARRFEAGGARLDLVAVDGVDARHDQPGDEHGEDGAREGSDDGAVQRAHVTPRPPGRRCRSRVPRRRCPAARP